MAHPTHIVAAGGYVFDGSGNILLVKLQHRGWDCLTEECNTAHTLPGRSFSSYRKDLCNTAKKINKQAA